MKLKRTLVAPAFVAGVALISGGWLLQSDIAGEQSVFQRARVFDEVLRYVEERYVEPHSSAELYQKAVEGLLTELGDPHTTFLSAEEYAQLHLQTTGEYGGLGVQIAPRDGWITAVGILPETPAERAGMRVGDRFLEIAGESAEGWTDDQAVKALRGPKGAPVTVKVKRVGVEEPIDFTIVRDEIHVRSVPYAYSLGDGIGYVNLVMFSGSSTEEIRAAIERLRAQGMRKLVLDLRNNPGGLLDQGVGVADLFLKPGQTIVETRARDPRQSEVFRAVTEETFPDLSVVVLVDEYSASASEIVAGALQDHDRAVVIGQTTFGKGSVQSLFPLSGGNFLKMTTAKWYTPVGRSIQKEEGEDEATPTREGAQLTPEGEVVLPDTAKAKRKPYRTDAGRIVYGGGGIVPDIVVQPDTATTVEQDFFKVYAKNAAKFESALLAYAVRYERAHPNLRPDFQVTPAMRREFFERLRDAGVPVEWETYQGAERFVNARLVGEIARSKFGPSVAAMRDDIDDRALQEAIRLLRSAPNQASLFRTANEMAQVAPRS